MLLLVSNLNLPILKTKDSHAFKVFVLNEFSVSKSCPLPSGLSLTKIVI